MTKKRHKKGNRYFYPLGRDFVVGFYNNRKDKAFIYDVSDKNKVQSKTWTSVEKNKRRVEPITNVNGKHTYLSRYINNTPIGLDCDHMDGNPSNATRKNLRNCTRRENNQNRISSYEGEVKFLDGAYCIEYPKGRICEKRYFSEEDANKELIRILKETVGEYSYKVSQANAKTHADYYFNDGSICYCGGVLEEIENLPQSHVSHNTLNMIRMRKNSGEISDETENRLIFELIKSHNVLINEKTV